MKKRYFIDEIPQESIERMLVCFEPQFKDYKAGETILAYSDRVENAGILLSGRAKLYYIDENGDTSLLEVYGKDDLFGEMFSLPLDNFEYIVTAETDCRAVFISYKHIITPCESACEHHSQLINNLFVMSAQKSQELSLHISILNQHTTRRKLLAYLKYIQSCRSAKVGEAFEIPLSLAALAEYLCVDRTAMMREIRLLKQDGIIDSDRRRFTLME